jgi:hypothetical protein
MPRANQGCDLACFRGLWRFTDAVEGAGFTTELHEGLTGIKIELAPLRPCSARASESRARRQKIRLHARVLGAMKRSTDTSPAAVSQGSLAHLGRLDGGGVY